MEWLLPEGDAEREGIEAVSLGFCGGFLVGKERTRTKRYELLFNKTSGMTKEQSQAVSECESCGCQNRTTCHKTAGGRRQKM